MNENTKIRHCRECGKEIKISTRDEGMIIQCQSCEHYMKVIAGCLWDIVTDEERMDIIKGTYSPDKYRAGSQVGCC